MLILNENGHINVRALQTNSAAERAVYFEINYLLFLHRLLKISSDFVFQQFEMVVHLFYFFGIAK